MTTSPCRPVPAPLRSAALALALACAALALPFDALADDVDPESVEASRDAAESRSATFQAVSGGQGEDVPGGPLLVAAYGAVLVLVLGYVLYLGRLSAGASRDLERLERAIATRLPEPRSGRGEAIAAELERAAQDAENARDAKAQESAKDT